MPAFLQPTTITVPNPGAKNLPRGIYCGNLTGTSLASSVNVLISHDGKGNITSAVNNNMSQSYEVVPSAGKGMGTDLVLYPPSGDPTNYDLAFMGTLTIGEHAGLMKQGQLPTLGIVLFDGGFALAALAGSGLDLGGTFFVKSTA